MVTEHRLRNNASVESSAAEGPTASSTGDGPSTRTRSQRRKKGKGRRAPSEENDDDEYSPAPPSSRGKGKRKAPHDHAEEDDADTSVATAPPKKKGKKRATAPDPGEPRFAFREGQVPVRPDNPAQGKGDMSRVLRQANTALWAARVHGKSLFFTVSFFLLTGFLHLIAEQDPSRIWMTHEPLSSVFPSEESGFLIPESSVLSHPISRGGPPVAFAPRRPLPAVVLNDRSLRLGSYPADAQAETGSTDESRIANTTVPLAHVPTVILQQDMKQEAKFPNPIRESDHEVLQYQPVSVLFLYHCFFYLLTSSFV